MSTDQLSIPIGVRLQLSDRFVQLLAREIASSTYAAGDVLPGEAMLALRYGVSKPTIRQGLKTLASLGLIRIQHGKRSVVLDQSNWNVLDPVIHQALSVAGRASELIASLWDLRELLETAAAGWAAERAGADQVAAISELAQQLTTIATGSRDVRSFLDVDRTFHDAVLRASGNPALRCVIEPTFRFLADQVWSTGSRARPEDLEALAGQHSRIAAAIADRDHRLARQAMAEHIGLAKTVETAEPQAGPGREFNA